nr:putative ribonuclease H-like domain-containing protein [Tanacetum cinerariifolium]
MGGGYLYFCSFYGPGLELLGLSPDIRDRKSKRASHPPKPVLNSKQRLHLLHMDLRGLMRIASINGKRINVLLQSPVIIIRTDNGIKFKNQTLVEAARTMLIFSRAPLFLWAEVIATACFTQNRFIIHRRFNKTPYELINGKKPDISFLHVFEALCYPKNDREDIGKLGGKDLKSYGRSCKSEFAEDFVFMIELS